MTMSELILGRFWGLFAGKHMTVSPLFQSQDLDEDGSISYAFLKALLKDPSRAIPHRRQCHMNISRNNTIGIPIGIAGNFKTSSRG